MNNIEKRATFSLAGLFSLRMLGLFMILPIFTIHASLYAGATPFLIGVALGIYGLTQAIGQLPFGALSDHYPRKHIIALGFSIFIVGSLLAAHAHTIQEIIIGRALQGSGAVGSVIIALLADLTRQEQRSRAMAIIGITIGFSFFLAMLLGPLLDGWLGLSGIFLLTALLGLFALIAIYKIVPEPGAIHVATPNQPFRFRLAMLLKDTRLLSLDIGIFCLHTILTASFVVIPLDIHRLLNRHIDDSLIYLPAMFIAILITFLIIGWAEKRRHVMPIYYASIIILMLTELGLWHFHNTLSIFWINLTLFFTAFNILEANLPSLVARYAPPALKGTAVGIYSTFQYSGIFCGGLIGGWLYGHVSANAVLLCCAVIALLWFTLSLIFSALSATCPQDTPSSK